MWHPGPFMYLLLQVKKFLPKNCIKNVTVRKKYNNIILKKLNYKNLTTFDIFLLNRYLITKQINL